MHRGWLAATAFAFGENTIRAEKVRDQHKTDCGLFSTCFSILKDFRKADELQLDRWYSQCAVGDQPADNEVHWPMVKIDYVGGKL